MGEAAVHRPTVSRHHRKGRCQIDVGDRGSLGGTCSFDRGFAYPPWCARTMSDGSMRNGEGSGKYEGVVGFGRKAKNDRVALRRFVGVPGRHVGVGEVEDDGKPFDEKMTRLVATLEEQFAEGARLEKAIRKTLRGVGYGG